VSSAEAAPRIQPGESERCIKLKFSTKAILNNARSPFCYLFVWLGASQSAPTTIIRAARNHGLLSGGGCRIIWRPAKLVVCEIASKWKGKKVTKMNFTKKVAATTEMQISFEIYRFLA
jgi:hypothetical protein